MLSRRVLVTGGELPAPWSELLSCCVLVTCGSLQGSARRYYSREERERDNENEWWTTTGETVGEIKLQRDKM
jgi:hypothetical protein